MKTNVTAVKQRMRLDKEVLNNGSTKEKSI